MKALVLTFDKYKPFAEHMIMCYEQLWPNHPFTFRIPYQSEEVKNYYESKFGSKVEMIKSPSGIVDTMFALSDDLDENEWVYWCMDDRYPMTLNVTELEKCYQYVMTVNDIDGLMFCHHPCLWMPENLFWLRNKIRTSDGQVYYRRKRYTMIWSHQFLRVNVVKTFFNLFPRDLKQAKDMDYIKDRAFPPKAQRLYMLDHNIAVYGEHTNRGNISKTCVDSFNLMGLKTPDGFEIVDKEMKTGHTTKWDSFKYVFVHLVNRTIGRS